MNPVAVAGASAPAVVFLIPRWHLPVSASEELPPFPRMKLKPTRPRAAGNRALCPQRRVPDSGGAPRRQSLAEPVPRRRGPQPPARPSGQLSAGSALATSWGFSSSRHVARFVPGREGRPCPEALGLLSRLHPGRPGSGGGPAQALRRLPCLPARGRTWEKARPREVCLGSGSPPLLAQDAAQAGEQGTKSKRSWNALETTAAFGIPLPAVQPWGLPWGQDRTPRFPVPGGAPRSRR